MWLMADVAHSINYRIIMWLAMIATVFLIFVAAGVASYVESRHEQG